MNKSPIDVMVDRFLIWKLPKDFAPDSGVSFDRKVNGEDRPDAWWPVGTNLFTADQAREMIEHLLGVNK